MGMGVFYALIRQFRSVKSKIWNPLGGGGGGGGGGGLQCPQTLPILMPEYCFGFISFAVLILAVFILRWIIII